MRRQFPTVKLPDTPDLLGAAIAGERDTVPAREVYVPDSSQERRNVACMNGARTATIEIEIEHPDPATPGSIWTLLWDGEAVTVRPIPGTDAGDPEDWGIPDARRDEIDIWRTEGEVAVIEQLLDNFAGGGAAARIVAVHGSATARRRTLEALRAFAEQHPQCAVEIRRFALEPTE